MVQPEYDRKISAKMVPHIWVGAACWPFIMHVGVDEFSSNGFYIPLSIFFLLVTIFSVFQGLMALKHYIYSDFIMLTVIPIILPMILGILYYVYVFKT